MVTHRDLGKSVSHVELNTPKLTSEQVMKVENECNERIREHKPVNVQYLTKVEAMNLTEVNI